MSNLTDTQLILLSAAAKRAPALLLPLAKGFKGNKAAASRVFAGLIKRGLVAEQTAKADEPSWREDKTGQRLTLVLTALGRKTLGLSEHRAAPKTKKAAKPVSVPDVKIQTKQARVITMLQRPDGATIDEIVAATDWQRHTVRGVISGALRKKLGLSVLAEKTERGHVYRIKIVAKKRAA